MADSDLHLSLFSGIVEEETEFFWVSRFLRAVRKRRSNYIELTDI